MIERVARAIWTMSGDSWPHDSFDNLPDGKKKTVMIYARAAIQALCDPGDGDVDEAYWHEKGELTRPEIKRAWKAMLDAALE